ncbi:endonuclease/exonuclease/phosphatase family protein [Allohahella sp. A8]|uniref:endonuclease/exonuclease/phosphatase family protein n=1 Tax=Allohahella sp. A8 TaxID=3141461 RepID=UPI003A803C9C
MKFKLMTYNVQDLFLQPAFPIKPEYLHTLSDEHWAMLGEADQELKPLSKLKALAQIILREDPDCVCLCEVGGPTALSNFNEFFLSGAYVAYLIPGNSDRGIESGFLLKKSLPFTAELQTNRHWPVPFQYLHEEDPEAYAVTALMAEAFNLGASEKRRLSRDIPVLHLYDPQGTCILSVMLAHLKSGYDPQGFDPGGQKRRAAEVQALIAIYHKLKAEKSNDHPVIVAGDFNGNASRDDTWAEFQPLYEATDLEDALFLAGLPRYERHTHMTFYGRTASAKQLDYIFLSKSLHQRLIPEESYVYRYVYDEDGSEMLAPFSFRDRDLLPSDHYPVVCVVALKD